jgi:hypothetical protein
MFSFLKWFGNLIESAKKNKGLWFTLLTVISLVGIFVSIYFVNFLVTDVAKKTYINQQSHYSKDMKNSIELHKELVLSIATAISQNGEVKYLFNSNDVNKSQKIINIANKASNTINKNLATKNISVTYKATNNIQNEKLLNGLDVDRDTIYLKAQVPVIDNNSTRLYVVVKEKIDALSEFYHKENKEFALILNEGSINKISSSIKKSDFVYFQDRYYLNKKSFDKMFIDQLVNVDMKEFIKIGYEKDANYFYVCEKAYNYNGDDIGLIVVAEKVNEENSFVNLIKNLVNNVTMVALGLIVSMILFLF